MLSALTQDISTKKCNMRTRYSRCI